MSNLIEKEQKLFFQTYKRLRPEIVRGEGPFLFDRNGKQYLDFFGGLAVNALGYGRSDVKRAITDQIEKYIHLSNFFVQETQVQLAEKLIAVTGYEKIFFTNSGTEAIEGAIKLARKWGKSEGKKTLFGMTNSFHGRTMGALSLTERPKYRKGYEPFLDHVKHIEFNNVNQLRASVDAQTLGVVLEFIQGEGGVVPVTHAFVNALKELREQFGFLVIADCIQCGIGRTGKFFSFEHFDFRPDIVVLAKAIGGGLPLGAFLGNERVKSVFTYGEHGSTFGGNPVACAAGIAVLHAVVDDGLMNRAKEIGERLQEGLTTLRADFPDQIVDVRGFGCMLGIELTRDGGPIVEELQERGILVNCTNTTVLRLLPPFILSNEHCDTLVSTLRGVFDSKPS